MAMSFTSAAAYGQVSRGDRYSGAIWATRSPVIAQHGMAATEQPLASALAIDILKKGGSAVDAVIAANAAIGLMQPVLSGVGGDLFAIVWDPKTRQVNGYNGSGRSAKGRNLAKLMADGGDLRYEDFAGHHGEWVTPLAVNYSTRCSCMPESIG